MQYDLVFYPNKDERVFETIKGFDDDNKLKGIVEFCHKFENYNDLINDLYVGGLLANPTLNGVFKIHRRISQKSKPTVFARGITFKSESKYYNTSYLQNYFVNHLNDSVFIKIILDTYYQYLLSQSQPAQTYLYSMHFELITKKSVNMNWDEKSELDIENDTRSFVKAFCEKHKSGQEWVVNYTNLTILARMVIAYERQLLGIDPNEPINDTLNIEEEINTLKTLVSHYTTLVNNPDISQEESEAYEARIETAKSKIEELKNHINRR